MPFSTTRSAALALLALPTTLLGAGPAAADVTPSGVPCANTEAQNWWVPTPNKTGGTNFGHIHLAACTPDEQHISGVSKVHVKLTLHDNPSKMNYASLVIKTDSAEVTSYKEYNIAGFTCPSGTCTREFDLPIDTAIANYSGRQEIRIRTFGNTPDGNQFRPSLNFHAYFDNGKTNNPIDRMPWKRMKGWYGTKHMAGYCQAEIRTLIPTAAVANWAPTVAVVNHAESGDLPVSRYRIARDADFHAGNPGVTIRQGSGQLQPTPVDLSGLSSGPHKLFVIAECDHPSGSTNKGIGVVNFTVP
jgi:hypothetical protein